MITVFGLSQTILDKIVATLSQYPAVQKACIYGSRATGNFAPGSDIDLAIFAAALTTEEFARLRFDLDNVAGVFKIDVVHVEQLGNDALKEKIGREGKEVFRRP